MRRRQQWVGLVGLLALASVVSAQDFYTRFDYGENLPADSFSMLDGYGLAIAVHGRMVVTGAPFASNDNTATSNGNGWIECRYITDFAAPDVGYQMVGIQGATDSFHNANDHFGKAMSMTGIVGTGHKFFAVGSPGKSSNNGAVYLHVFEEIIPNVTAVCAGKLKLSSPSGTDEQFGAAVSVSLSPDGVNYFVLVGAPTGKVSSVIIGRAYLYTCAVTTDTVTCSPPHTISAMQTANSRVGSAVAVDGGIVVVGATGYLGAGGAAVLFCEPNNGIANAPTCTEGPIFTPALGTANTISLFGNSVSVSGTLVVIGCRRCATDINASNPPGAVYMTSCDPEMGACSSLQRFTSPDNITTYVALYGASVAAHSDGQGVVVGASRLRVNGFDDSGAVYMYRCEVTTGVHVDCQYEAKLVAEEEAAASRYLGAAVSAHPPLVAVGANYDTRVDTSQVSAYIFNGICVRGRYGPGCAQECAVGCANVCDSFHGRCDCVLGWTNDQCTACNEPGFELNVDLECTCKPGHYGPTCQECMPCGNGVCNDTAVGDGVCECDNNWAHAVNGSCAVCMPGQYGEDCTSTCIDDCAGHGVCLDGTTGDGSCVCDAGWETDDRCATCAPLHYGSSCTQCIDCGHGVCAEGLAGDGTCACESGWARDNTGSCTLCTLGHYGPTCSPCASCNGRGGCLDGLEGDGSCACFAGWSAASRCADCADGHYGASCSPCIDCGHGTCNGGVAGNGSCACDANWQHDDSGACTVCKPGYYGGQCTACADDCSGHGVCRDGTAGDGGCTCDAGWSAASRCASCADRYFSDADGECTACDASCGACVGAGAHNCTACASGRGLTSDGRCVTECPAGTWLNGTTCSPCHASCAECALGGTASHCTRCADSNAVLVDGEGCAVTSCPEGTFANADRICEPCNVICATCESADACTSCADPEAELLASGTCYATPAGLSMKLASNVASVAVAATFIGIACLLLLLAFLFSPTNARVAVIATMLLTFANTATDIIFVVVQANTYGVLSGTTLAGIVFLAMPALFNIIAIALLVSTMARHDTDGFLGRNMVAVVFVSIISVLNAEIMLLLRSQAFELAALSADWSETRVARVKQLGLITLTFQVIPMLIIQATVIVGTGIDIVTIVALILSALFIVSYIIADRLAIYIRAKSAKQLGDSKIELAFGY